jgi:hypothetical protein
MDAGRQQHQMAARVMDYLGGDGMDVRDVARWQDQKGKRHWRGVTCCEAAAVRALAAPLCELALDQPPHDRGINTPRIQALGTGTGPVNTSYIMLELSAIYCLML